jgi:hypothetical protein
MDPGLRQDGGYCGGRFGAPLLAMTVLVVLLMVFDFLRVLRVKALISPFAH